MGTVDAVALPEGREDFTMYVEEKIGIARNTTNLKNTGGFIVKAIRENCQVKTLLVLSIRFSVITLPALGALTDADLDKIRLIVNDSEKRVKPVAEGVA